MTHHIPLKLRHTVTNKIYHVSSIQHAKRFLRIKNNIIIKNAIKDKTFVKKYSIAIDKRISKDSVKCERFNIKSIPSCYEENPCTYLFLFSDEDGTNIKYGMSRKVISRMKEHRRTFEDISSLHVFPCLSIEHAEKTEKVFGKYTDKYHTSVIKKNKKRTEILNDISIEVAVILMRAICDLTASQCVNPKTIQIPEFSSL